MTPSFPPDHIGGEQPCPGWCLRGRGAGVLVRCKVSNLSAYHGEERSIVSNRKRAFEKLKVLKAFHEFGGPSSLDVGIVRDWTEEELY